MLDIFHSVFDDFINIRFHLFYWANSRCWRRLAPSCWRLLILYVYHLYLLWNWISYFLFEVLFNFADPFSSTCPLMTNLAKYFFSDWLSAVCIWRYVSWFEEEHAEMLKCWYATHQITVYTVSAENPHHMVFLSINWNFILGLHYACLKTILESCRMAVNICQNWRVSREVQKENGSCFRSNVVKRCKSVKETTLPAKV